MTRSRGTIPPADSPQPISERDHPGTTSERQPWRHGWLKRRESRDAARLFPETLGGVGGVAAELKRCRACPTPVAPDGLAWMPGCSFRGQALVRSPRS
jgi:hypothetical protein